MNGFLEQGVNFAERQETFLLGELAREEAALARFRAELETLQPRKPKVVPHPAAIAGFVRGRDLA